MCSWIQLIKKAERKETFNGLPFSSITDVWPLSAEGEMFCYESKENKSSSILWVSVIEALHFCQPRKYLGLMSKSETKKEPRDISVWKCPHSHLLSLSMVAHSTKRSILHICILWTAGMKLTCQHIFKVQKCFNQMPGCRGDLQGGLSLRLSHIDGSNQMFLSFRKCLGGDVCKGLLASEHSINASQLLYNSVYLSVTVLDSIYQGVRLSCTFSACFWYWEKMACLRDILTAFKRCIKKPCDRFI